jgi:8-oxo-dGTP diphosphatase
MGAHDQGADSSPGRWTAIPRTLCFITNGDDILLIKRGEQTRVFPGRYNGIGGHIERFEDPRSGAIREIGEETGLSIRQLCLRGICHVDPGQDVGILLFVFTAISDSRALSGCDEGSLHWIPIHTVQELPLVEDLPVLLPRLFGPGDADTPFFAHVYYDSSDRIILTFAEEG